MKKIITALILFGFISTTHANANIVTVDLINQVCANQSTSDLCDGYIEGTLDGSALTFYSLTRKQEFCPGTTPYKTIVTIVKEDLKEVESKYSKSVNDPAALWITAIANKDFACDNL